MKSAVVRYDRVVHGALLATHVRHEYATHSTVWRVLAVLQGELEAYVPMLLERAGWGAPSPGPGAGLVHGYSTVNIELLTQDLQLLNLNSE